jgi:hypothetical protein
MRVGRTAVVAVVLGILAPAGAESAPRAAPGTPEYSAQRRDETRRPRIRIQPGRLLYRDCKFWLAQEYRPSGTVIVPRQHCWWVRG